MIDLDALRSTRRLSWSDVRENLALLNHYFWSRCNRSDRYRFLNAYLKARREPTAPEASGALPRHRAVDPVLGRAALEALGPSVLEPRTSTSNVHRKPGVWAVASRDLDLIEPRTDPQRPRDGLPDRGRDQSS